MIAVGISNIIDDSGNVNRALIQVWDISPDFIHIYMGLIILASICILASKHPAWWWYMIGISYIVLILASVVALAISDLSITTFSSALRVFALNGLLFFLIIKNLRRNIQ
jgi:hypothetical protein